MADSFKAKQITSLTENTSMADTDIVPVGNAGTSTLRRIKWANILAAIKSKITSWTYNFNTSSKTLEGAVNEMHGDITALNNGLANKLNTADEVFRTFDPSSYKDNANWACFTGLYRTAPNTVGAQDYGVLIVFAAPYPSAGFNGKNWIHQLWFTNNNIVQHRFSVNKTDGSGWSAWTTL